MAKQIYYKKYERGTRLQTVDTQYAGGMLYTNTPLAEQYSKALVNYDITSDSTLRSRPGLCKVSSITTEETFTDKLLISSQPMTTFDTNLTYQHIVVGDKHKTDVEDESEVKDKLALGIGELAFFKSDGSTLTKAADAHEAFMRVHSKAEIHGLTLETPLPRYVGCRAFNNDYYWFKPDGKLHHSGYVLKSYNQDNNEATYGFSSEVVEPKECTITEAVNIGYNMLLPNPYAFDKSPFGEQNYASFSEFLNSSANIDIQGILPYKDEKCTQLELTPQPNQQLYFKIICANLPRKDTETPLNCIYDLKIESSTSNGVSWSTQHEKKIAAEDLWDNKTKTGKLIFTLRKTPLKRVIIRVTLTAKEDTSVSADAKSPCVYITAFDFSEKKDTDAIKYDLQQYTLKYAEGMVYWKNRLILWGVPEDKTMLFVSETNDPSYFPYPGNVNLFDEPIVNVIPLLDNLIVFTTSKIYVMAIDTDYIHLTQKCIQNNLRIAPYDVHLMQVVKNMIFFKSGNYYYMIVPKANSLTGELVIAPVSKNIEYFLDNFKEEVYKILDIVYNYNYNACEELKLIHYYNYLDYEDVSNVYVFKAPSGRYLNFCLLYSTIARGWRIYTYETSNIMVPITADATAKSTYGILNKNTYETYRFNQQTAIDDMGTEFKNYQLYDSGYRDQEYNLKKRYRELQFIIYNRSLKNLCFGTGFFIDGETRRNLYRVEPFIRTFSDLQYTTDYKGSNQHVELVINSTFDNVCEVPGATILGAWVIDQSVFPEQTVYKVRFPIAGKGYAPRALLVNKDELQHDILNTSYVYRSLYSR